MTGMWPIRRVRTIVLGMALVGFGGLAMPGCGNSPDGPPADLGSKKTPSEILKEAKARDQGAKP